METNKKSSDVCNPEELDLLNQNGQIIEEEDVNMGIDDEMNDDYPQLQVEDLSTYRPWLYSQNTFSN